MGASFQDRAATPSEPSPKEVSGAAGIPCAERGAIEMMARDNARMRLAGGRLAEAAVRVITDYDGLHRLSMAVAEWSQAIADEGDRRG